MKKFISILCLVLLISGCTKNEIRNTGATLINDDLYGSTTQGVGTGMMILSIIPDTIKTIKNTQLYDDVENHIKNDGVSLQIKPSYNKEGYNEKGFNREGFNKIGYDKDGYDIQGFNQEGYDRASCDIDKINKITNSKYNKEGYDCNGYDKDGYDKDGVGIYIPSYDTLEIDNTLG